MKRADLGPHVISIATAVTLCGCTPVRVTSARARANLVVYDLQYVHCSDPTEDTYFRVRASWDGSSARVEVKHSGDYSGSSATESRSLTPADWELLEECWETDTMLWSTPSRAREQPSHGLGGRGWGAVTIEASRGERHLSLDYGMITRGPDRRLLECAWKMIAVSRVELPGWWPNREACAHDMFWDFEAAHIPTRPGSVTDGCPVGMTSLSGGAFTMTDGHQEATVPSFCIDRALVSVDDYSACVRAGQCSAAHLRDRSSDGARFAEDSSCNHQGGEPMTCVDWSQAAAFCRAQGKRLPSEQEWEWAARGTPTDLLNDPGERAGAFRVEADPGLSPLWTDSWEWTSSGAGKEERVLKDGGSWVEWIDGGAQSNLALGRASRSPGFRADFVGFRCAR